MSDQQEPLPAIGTSKRETLETCTVDRADTILREEEAFGTSLARLRTEIRYSGWDIDAARELSEHVEQVWVGRCLR